MLVKSNVKAGCTCGAFWALWGQQEPLVVACVERLHSVLNIAACVVMI